MKKALIFISLIVCMVLASTPAFGGGFIKSKGQTVYVAFSHNCQNPFGSPTTLIPADECTNSVNARLIIRNVNSDDSITVNEMNIYEPDGTLVGDYLDYLPIPGPFDLAPLASRTFVFHPSTPYWSAHYHGRPSFIVKWTAEMAVYPPIISSAIVIINRAPPEDSINPWLVEGLTSIPGVVLRINPKGH